jgi:hypothetical protein
VRLHVSKVEAEWLLLVTQHHKMALSDGSLKSAMGKAALTELEQKITTQYAQQLDKLEGAK